MRAIMLSELVGPSGLRLVNAPEPQAGAGQVLIDVHAAGVSFPDLLQTQGKYQDRAVLPFVPGSEVAGVVRSAPPGCGVQPGSRVAALISQGGFQEAVAVEPDQVLPLPDAVSFEAGAALPMNYLTALVALGHRGHMAPGEVVLVHGAGGGIGTACIQVARALGGSAIGVVSTDAKAEAALEAGAAHAVRVPGFLARVRELTQGAGVDLVADPVGGQHFTDSLRALAPLGRLLVIGFTSGEIPTLKVNRLLLRNIDVVGVGFGGPGSSTHRQLWDELLPHISSGVMAPVISAVLPLDRAAAAVESLERRTAVGKLVLQVR